MSVLGAVCGVDLIVDVILGWDEDNVFVDATSLEVTFAAVLGCAEPGCGAPAPGSNVQIVVHADDPDRHRLAQRSVV